MAITIMDIRRVRVRGGLQIQAVGRTATGQKFIYKATNILTEGKTPEEIQSEVDAAVAKYSPD